MTGGEFGSPRPEFRSQRFPHERECSSPPNHKVQRVPKMPFAVATRPFTGALNPSDGSSFASLDLWDVVEVEAGTKSESREWVHASVVRPEDGRRRTGFVPANCLRILDVDVSKKDLFVPTMQPAASSDTLAEAPADGAKVTDVIIPGVLNDWALALREYLLKRDLDKFR